MRKIFAADLRSLAAFRIAVAFLLLVDLIDRARDLTAHYTDFGVMPRAALAGALHDPFALSFHTLGGSSFFEAILFLIAGFFAVLLLLGQWTRAASIASWIFLLSLHHRNAYVLYGGDLFLRLMVFWGMFLPWGRRWSLDALGSRPSFREGNEASSIATAAILLQVVFVYLFTGLLKAKDPSWQHGMGVYYALALDTYASSLGTWLLQFPKLVHGLSHVTLTFELVGPLALLATFRWPRLRLLTIAAFVIFQAGLASCLSLGLFPWISTAGMLPFLPSFFWDRKSRVGKTTRPASAPLPWAIRIFAGYCLLMVFLWNLGTLVPLPLRNNAFVWSLPRYLALNQGWVMFMSPKVVDGWYVIPGRLEDGSWIDLFHGHAGVRWGRPKQISAVYKDMRWAKYMTNLWDYPALRPYFAWHLCHQWNHVGNRLEELEIDFQLELTRPDDPKPPPERVSLGTYLCSSDFSF